MANPFRTLWELLKKWAPGLIIGVGVTLYAAAEFSWWTHMESLNRIIRDLGRLAFVGGLFEFLIRLRAFLSIFRDETDAITKEIKAELSKVETQLKGEITSLKTELALQKEELPKIIFFNKDYLAKRSDLRKIWADVSKVLYKEKFPEICAEIEEVIINHYFPTEHDFYYTNYRYEIKINDHPTDDFIELEEIIDYTVKPNNENSIMIESKTDIIRRDPEDTISSYVLNQVFVNGKPFNFSDFFTLDLTDDKKIIKGVLNAPLAGDKEYRIRMERKKVYCVKAQGYSKTFSFNKFCKNLTVDVTYQSGIKVAFYQLGNVKKYKDSLGENGTNNRIVKESDGIVFPSQGFVLIINKVK